MVNAKNHDKRLKNLPNRCKSKTLHFFFLWQVWHMTYFGDSMPQILDRITVWLMANASRIPQKNRKLSVSLLHRNGFECDAGGCFYNTVLHASWVQAFLRNAKARHTLPLSAGMHFFGTPPFPSSPTPRTSLGTVQPKGFTHLTSTPTSH